MSRKFRSGDRVKIRKNKKSVKEYFVLLRRTNDDDESAYKAFMRARRGVNFRVERWDPFFRLYVVVTDRGKWAGNYRSCELEHAENATRSR